MATLNPLEQKARSSFRKGLLIAGLIGLLIALILGYYIYQLKDNDKKRIEAQKYVAILKTGVKSGEEITDSMLINGLANGEVVSEGALTVEKVRGEMSEEASTGEVRTKKLIAKIDIPAKAILTKEMFSTEDVILTDDLREEEYNVVILPSNLTTGDTIDIRLRLPTGEDYVVISKKIITLPEIASETSTNLMTITVNEAEQLSMSAAIVESYKINGSKLYATKYTEPGIQEAAKITYMPPSETVILINTDPNIVATAKDALVARYNESYNTYRNGIQSVINSSDSEAQKSQVEAGTSTEISTQESDRRTYLDSLGQ